MFKWNKFSIVTPPSGELLLILSEKFGLKFAYFLGESFRYQSCCGSMMSEEDMRGSHWCLALDVPLPRD